MSYESLRTVREVADLNPAFSEAAIRWLIFNKGTNGFDEVCVKVGRRILIDMERLDAWIESQRCGKKGERGSA